tara:strand:+ start:40 stop:336 length:297 start_codon:yes stop_codon:yes gene_type:complete
MTNETMTEEQRQQSWLTMKQHLVDLCWELLREDPANLNTLQRCHDHIKENFELLAAVRQIDPRCKPWLWILLDKKEIDVGYINMWMSVRSKVLLEEQA